MRESWRKINCTKIQMPSSEKDVESKDRKPWKLLDFISSIFLYIVLILAIITTILILRCIHAGNSSPILAHLSKTKLKAVIKSIINNDFHEHFGSKRLSGCFGNVQLLDENNNVLWSEDFDTTDLNEPSSFKFKSIETYIRNDEHDDNNRGVSIEVSSDTLRHTRSTDKGFHPLLSRLVNCARFIPVSRDKYLVSPNLEALHTCYQYGARLDELENEVAPRNDSSPRYDLENLYLKCEDVFTEAIQILTAELTEDYRRCKRAGAVDRRAVDFIEHRFVQSLVEHDHETKTTEISVPENLQSGTTSLPRLDIRGFVNCAHVEYQMVDSLESPSEAALRRCEGHGVTAEEIERGFDLISRTEQYRFDIDTLYISCEEAFASGLNWITDQLIKDYHRCKSLGRISEQTRRIIENTFYEHIYRGAPEESPVKSATDDYGASVESISVPPATRTEPTGTEATMPETSGRHAFANCRRIENMPYRICIKVIASYSDPAA